MGDNHWLCVFQSSLKRPLHAMVGKVGAGVVFLLVCAGPLLECGASHTDDIVWEEAPELQFVQAEEAHWHKVAKFLPSFNESPTAMPESEVDDFELLLQRPSLRARLLSKAKIAGKAAGAAAAGAGGNAKQIKKAVKHAAKSAAWLAWGRHTKKRLTMLHKWLSKQPRRRVCRLLHKRKQLRKLQLLLCCTSSVGPGVVRRMRSVFLTVSRMS